jgi:Esterase/lipase
MKKRTKIIITIILIFLIFVLFTPYPTVWLLRCIFKNPVYKKAQNYEQIKNKVVIKENINYNSKYDKGYLDIISPKKVDEKLPVIIWVHGGAFVAGNKEGVESYMVMLANEGYIVVSINYSLAPKTKYPTPIKQLDEAYTFIKENSEKYNIDMNKVFLGGDSAGATIVSQFASKETNEEYRKILNMKKVTPGDNLKGMILFCGPYDFFSLKIENKLINFVSSKVMYSYFGSKKWKDEKTLKEASVLNHITKNFPPSFITDGNTFSFEDQGKDLVKILKEKNIEVKEKFYDKKDVTLSHEYQFQMDTKEGKEVFSLVTKFLNKKSK